MKVNRLNQRLQEITPTTLIVGVDIAKSVHWSRCVDYRGVEVGKALSFKCDRKGFNSIIAQIEGVCKSNFLKEKFDRVIVGMEPTGHYWKTLANYLQKEGIRVVGVNPYHTKKAKELDDNSQTKSDFKDALTIARLVKDGRYFDPYLPKDVFAELRVLTNTRVSVMGRANAVKNIITAIIDEYFPELCGVFKNPLKGKASRQVLRVCPFPILVIAMGEEYVLTEIKKAAKNRVGMKKVCALMAAAKDSIGVDYGLAATRIRLNGLLDELEQHERRLDEIENAMEEMLKVTGYAESMVSIKGVGVVSAASFLGEVGDPLRFQNARQIVNYAGYNLIEDSSGKSKSGTCISKRGRGKLRSVLYQMAFTIISHNAEMKSLYRYLITRTANPLRKKQALVAIAKKVVTMIYALLKKKTVYKPELVLGEVRREMLKAA